MAEIRPPEYGVVRTDVAGSAIGRTAQQVTGIADVLGTVAKVVDSNRVDRFRKDVKGAIDDTAATQGTIPEEDVTELSNSVPVNDLTAKMSRLRSLMQQGNSNTQARAQLEAKRVTNTYIAKFPHLRDELITATNQELGLSTTLSEIGAQDAYLTTRSALAEDEYDRLVTLSEKYGVDQSLEPGSLAWNTQFVQMAKETHAAKATELRLQRLAGDDTISAREKSIEFNKSLFGNSSPINANMRNIRNQVDRYMQAVQSGTVTPEQESAFQIQKQQLISSTISMEGELQAALTSVFNGAELQTPFGTSSQSAVQAQITRLQDLRNGIANNDVSMLEKFKYEEEIRIRLLSNTPEFQKFRTVSGAVGGAEAFSLIAKGDFGPKGLILRDQVVTDLQERIGTWDFAGYQADRDVRGFLAKEDELATAPDILQYTTSVVAGQLESKPDERAKVESTLDMWDNNSSGVTIYSDPAQVAKDLSGFSGVLGYWNSKNIDTKETHDRVFNTFSSGTFTQKIDQALKSGDNKSRLAALGETANNYVSAVTSSREERLQSYREILNTQVRDMQYAPQNFEYLRDLVKLDLQALEESNEIVFVVKPSVAKGLQGPASEIARQLSALMNRDARTIWNIEKARRGTPNVSFKAVTSDQGMSEFFVVD